MSLYDPSKKGPKFPMDTKRIYHRDAQIDSGKGPYIKYDRNLGGRGFGELQSV